MSTFRFFPAYARQLMKLRIGVTMTEHANIKYNEIQGMLNSF